MKRTFEQTLELVSNSPASIFTKDDVIKLMHEMEMETKFKVNVDGLKAAIKDSVEDMVGGMYTDEFVDYNSADFSLCGNEIQIDDISFNKGNLMDTIENTVNEAIDEFFPESSFS